MNNNKFLAACADGNLLEIQKYYDHRYIYSGLICAYYNGYLEIVQWLKSKGALICANDEEAFKVICGNGYLKIAKWLEPLNINIHIKNEAFRLACKNGHLKVAKWLDSLNIDIHLSVDAFRLACTNGYLEVAQWLESKGINIYNEIESVFITTCSNGYLEIAQWLESKGVNIHADDECAFKYACLFGHLDIAQWLESKGVNVHTDNECAFRWAYNFNNLNILIWLYQYKIDLIFLNTIPHKIILEEIFQLNDEEIILFKNIIIGNEKKIKKIINEKNYDMLNHFAFKKSCYENRIEIVKYLLEINTNYYFEVDNNNKIIYYEVRTISKNARNIN